MKLTFDPLILPVESVAGESALAADRMNAHWLRCRFMQQPKWKPESMDGQAISIQEKHFKRASVLIPIVMHANRLTLLFTERAAHLTDHAGQVSFPGGRWEDSDSSPIETALREADEEIGLVRTQVEVIGSLPEYFTSTYYRVTPVVCLVNSPLSLRIDANEVAEIFEVPLAFLMDGLHHQLRSVDLPDGCRRRFYTIPYGRFFIWGVTAGILRNLFHFLRAE